MKKITRDELVRLLKYEPETGVFKRLVRMGPAVAGSVAGFQNREGYIALSVNGQTYYAHRLAWLYIHGNWPSVQIDHIDGDRSNNRICNLREATPLENLSNIGLSSRNTSGCRGVHWHNGINKWVARVMFNRKLHHLGYFASKDEAVEAVRNKRLELHGRFARL